MAKGLLNLALLLCPRPFRKRYQDEIFQVYSAQSQAEPNGFGRGVLTLRTIFGLVATGLNLRLEPLWADVSFALRQMVNRPGHALAVVMTLALGIGSSTALFGLFHSVLMKPLALHEPDRLVMVWNRYGDTQTSVATADYHYRRASSQTLTDLAAAGGEQSMALTGDGEPLSVTGVLVSANFFDVAGVAPSLGRPFAPGEDEIGRGQVVVLGDGLWQRRFGGSETVLGQSIIVDGEARTVVGVMPEAFSFPHKDIDIWAPLQFAADKADYSRHGNEFLYSFGRLSPGLTVDDAQREINQLAATFKQLVPDRMDYLENSQWGGEVESVEDYVRGHLRPVLTVLLGAAALVLLLVCANVTSLQLSRVLSRQSELAVRASLGASKTRIIRQLLTEIVVLVLFGGMLALGLIVGLELLMDRLIPDLIERGDLLVGNVLAFGVAVMLITAVVCGFIPARRFRGARFLNARGVLGGKQAQRFRKVSVVAQTAISVVLVSGAVTAVLSLNELLKVDPGFEAQHRFAFRLKLPDARYGEASQRANLVSALEANLAVLPQVRSAGANGSLPLLDDNWTSSFNVEHFTPGPGQPPPNFEVRPVSPGYRQAMGINLVAGRDLSELDHAEAPGVVLIDEKLARTYFSDVDPIGQRIGRGNENDGITWSEVVGVVTHVRNEDLGIEGSGQVYLPYAQIPTRSPWVVVHTASAGAESVRDAVAAVVHDLDPLLPLDRFVALEAGVQSSLSQARLNGSLLGAFGLLSIVLAMVGIYGLVNFSVASRTNEFGLKMALGAHSPTIMLGVMKQGLQLAGVGVGLGVVLSLWLQQMLTSRFVELEAPGAGIMLAVCVGLGLTAMLASAIPARRAANISPSRALQHS